MAFTGDRVVTRTVKIRLPSAETNVPTTEIYDRQGRLASVTEPSGTNGANVTTTYGYDLAGRLVSVAAGGDQDRSWQYDGRGLLTSQTSAEAATVSYDRYDSRGHAHHRNDGLHQLAFDFDPAERLIDVKRDATGELLKQFVFGNGTTNLGGDRAKGRLFQASRFNYTRIAVGKIIQTYEYGSEGKQGAVSKLTTDFYIGAQHSNTFEQSYTWSSFGKIDTTTLPKQTGAAGPAGEQPSTTRSYTRGWLTRVNGSNGNYINNVTYHPNGAWSSITHANLVRDDQTLLDATRPRSFKATGSGLSWASGVYAYDGAGNITGIGGDTSFRYDRVSRLVSADVLVEGLAGNVIFSDGFESGDTSCWGAASCSASGDVVSQSFTYDNYGNLTGIAGEVGGLALTTDINNNHLDAASYDAAGQVTAWNGHTYDYDDLGMLLEYDRNSSTDDWLYLYDANDQRILNFKVGSGAYNRWTLRDLDGSVLRQFLYERDDCPDPPQCSDPPISSWIVERDYLHAGGMLLGARRYDGNGVVDTYHFHLDHLGSPRLITNAAGAEVSRHTYMPFGLEVSPPDFSERMKFTGHERDIHEDDSIATDLDYMRARHYNPQVGRFLSPDPGSVGASLIAPQTWNAYAYVNNNPMAFTDPYGLEATCVSGGQSSGFSPDTPHDAGKGDAGMPICSEEVDVGSADSVYRPMTFGDLGQAGLGLLDLLFQDPAPTAITMTLPNGERYTGIPHVSKGMIPLLPGELLGVGGSAAVRLGQAGEAAVRSVAEIGPKEAIEVAGRARIPDGITRTVLSEVKNVARLSFSLQLRDYSAHAAANGLRFDLWVRPGTRGTALSGPLSRAIADGLINLRFIP